MSLIEKALQKAGRVAHKPKPQPLHAKPPLLAPKKPDRGDKGFGVMNKTILGVIVLSTMVILLAFFFSEPRLLHSSPKQGTEQLLPSRTGAERPSIVSPPLSPAFSLNGVSQIDEKLIAVINGQLVGIGDRLQEGALVKKIQGRRVILEFQGREISLALS